MAVIGKVWRHEFLAGDPPIIVTMRRVDVFEFMAEMSVRAEATAATSGDVPETLAAGFRLRSEQVLDHIEDVTGLEVAGPDGGRSALAWPADRAAIVAELQAAPLHFTKLVRTFADRYYGSDLGNSEPPSA